MFGKHRGKDTKAEPRPLLITATSPEIASLAERLDEIVVDGKKKIAELQAMADRIGQGSRGTDHRNLESDRG